jgi:hypothetical protein
VLWQKPSCNGQKPEHRLSSKQKESSLKETLICRPEGRADLLFRLPVVFCECTGRILNIDSGLL